MLLLHHHCHEEKRLTQRDSETRERNEEKRTFATARPTSSEHTVAGFIIRDRSDDAFETTSEIICTFYCIIARRREAEEEPIARARVPSFPSSLICDTKTKRETDELRKQPVFCHPRSFRRRLRNDLRLGSFLHHRSTSRSRRRTHSARARAYLLLLSSLLFTRAIFTNEKQEEKKKTKCASSSGTLFSRPRSFGTISDSYSNVSSSSLDAWREETEEEEKPRVVVVVVFFFFESAHLLVFISVFGCFVSLKKSARIFYAR